MNAQSAPVLIIEDSEEDFEITVAALKLANMRSPILRCANGKEVRELLDHQGRFQSLQRPSLILLDLNLNGADGRILLPQFRQTEWLRPVPITVLTTSSNPGDIESCYSHGANTYLIKPVNLEKFEAMILNLITFWFDTAALPSKGRWQHAKFID